MSEIGLGEFWRQMRLWTLFNVIGLKFVNEGKWLKNVSLARSTLYAYSLCLIFSLPLNFLGLNQWGFVRNINLSFVGYLSRSITPHVSNIKCCVAYSIVSQELLSNIWAEMHFVTPSPLSTSFLDTRVLLRVWTVALADAEALCSVMG